MWVLAGKEILIVLLSVEDLLTCAQSGLERTRKLTHIIWVWGWSCASLETYTHFYDNDYMGTSKILGMTLDSKGTSLILRGLVPWRIKKEARASTGGRYLQPQTLNLSPEPQNGYIMTLVRSLP